MEVTRLFVCTVSLIFVAAASVDYSYTGIRGPSHWGELKPEWAQCKLGHKQSPIAIRDKHAVFNSGLQQLRPRYTKATWSLFSVQYIYKVFLSGAHCTLPIDNTTYVLTDFHFHTPSEHTVDGVGYPLELHMVHVHSTNYTSSSPLKIAVVSKLFKLGHKSPLLARLLSMQPGRNTSMNVGEYLNLEGPYYRYMGSFTTPPCSEGVEWRILKQKGTVSAGQLKQIERLLQGKNARPSQRSNNRPVFYRPSRAPS